MVIAHGCQVTPLCPLEITDHSPFYFIILKSTLRIETVRININRRAKENDLFFFF